MSNLSKVDNLLTVHAERTIDASNSAHLKDQLKAEMTEGVEGIVFDLSATETIDSIGLALLAATHNSLAKQGTRLELINTRADLLTVFNLMRLDRYFKISGTPV